MLFHTFKFPTVTYVSYLRIKAPWRVAQSVGASPPTPKGRRFDPHLGRIWETTLSLPAPSSLSKIIKQILG